MEMKKDVVVLGAKRVQFENGGDKVEGTQVWYHETVPTDETDIKGFIPNKAWLPLAEYQNIKTWNFPTDAVATVAIDLQKGKLKITGFNPKK